jgi:PilZ domain
MLTLADAEQRQAPRLRALIGARIVFNNGQATLDCLIRDVSETGAKLILSAPVPLPDRFELIIPQKGITRRVRVAWRRATEIGVRFEEDQGSEQAGAPQSEAALKRRIRALEAQVAWLQSRLALLTEG